MPAHPEWATIALLGALHGVNPAMGWLFAVSLGLQAQRGRAVWSALGPLALGHALAVVAALATAAALGVMLPLGALRWVAAVALLAFGVLHLRGHRHLAWAAGGMRVGARELTLWSFVVSSAHGAGLMVLPFVLPSAPTDATTHAGTHAGHEVGGHATHLAGITTGGELPAALATLLHTATYLAVAGAIAWFVYARLGLRFLRRAWINMDVIWGAALILTALATVVHGQDRGAGTRWGFASVRYEVGTSGSMFAGYGLGPVFAMAGASHNEKSGQGEVSAGLGVAIRAGRAGDHWLAVTSARNPTRELAQVYWLPTVRTPHATVRATIKMNVPYDGAARALAIAPLSFTRRLGRGLALGPAVDVVMKEGARPVVGAGAQVRFRLPGIGAGVDVLRDLQGDDARLRMFGSASIR